MPELHNANPTSTALARFRRSHEFWLLAVVLLLVLALSLATDTFLTLQNLFDLLRANAFVGILASGLLAVLIAGHIDISFTATISVAQYLALTVGIRYGLGRVALFALAGAPLDEALASNTASVRCLAYRAPGAALPWLANMTARAQPVHVDHAGARPFGIVLDEASFECATTALAAFQAGVWALDLNKLELGAFVIARVCVNDR